MSLTKVSYSMIQKAPINAYDYGATGDGSDETTKLQAAITAAISAGRDLYIPSGTYKITSTLNIASTSIKVYGAGRYETNIDSFATGSAILCSGWGGVLDNFGIYVNNATGNGIEVGNSSLNCAISNVYLQVQGAYLATTTGSGIYLNETSGFSGGLEIRTVYALGFKYGVRMKGPTPLSNATTWTTVSMYNLWLVGKSGGVVAGSVGIYMDAGTNGIGTCMYGGTIESFATGIVVENGSFGGVFETDMEDNTADYAISSTFNGRVIAANGVPARSQATNGLGVDWYKNQQIGGGFQYKETYYKTIQVLTSGNEIAAGNVAWTTYHNASLIDGNPIGTYGLKFEVGVGFGSANGASVHPSQHFIRLGDNKLHWGDLPSTRTGNQIVAWKQGDICYNLLATIGQPTGWMCTVSGTPGTWVAMANL